MDLLKSIDLTPIVATGGELYVLSRFGELRADCPREAISEPK